MVVDSDRTNFEDLVELVVEKYPPGYMEVAHIQYYDEALKTFPEIKSDHELMCMFSKHRKRKVIIMFITYRGCSDPFEPVTKWDLNNDCQPKNNIELDEGAHLRNPKADDCQPKNNIELDEGAHLRNHKAHTEHVGVKEETMYFKTKP